MSTDNKPQQQKEMNQNYLSGCSGTLKEQPIIIIHLSYRKPFTFSQKCEMYSIIRKCNILHPYSVLGTQNIQTSSVMIKVKTGLEIK